MASINPNSSTNPSQIQMMQGLAGQQISQQAQVVQEKSDSALKKAADMMINMQFMDTESSERLSFNEKMSAIGLGLLSLVGFTTTAHALAGLDPALGTINPMNKEAAYNSPLGRFARTVDGLTPPQGSFANLPKWMRAYIGDMPTDEYNRYWLENHIHAVNATSNKLTKASHAEDALVPRYVQHYKDIETVNWMVGIIIDEMKQQKLEEMKTTIKKTSRKNLEEAKLKVFKNFIDELVKI